ncbi:hypothetical protein EFA69_14600 [Rufibacter immobilis]|uniref:Uncharacterized protein n=1 Tax=Rufibacter immobilis TaxID=1348778 RepID=A0A3M9MPC1_9BACT|nr:hypothetical protein EFA69_14600 [Rufibacter immobilis]
MSPQTLKQRTIDRIVEDHFKRTNQTDRFAPLRKVIIKRALEEGSIPNGWAVNNNWVSRETHSILSQMIDRHTR